MEVLLDINLYSDLITLFFFVVVYWLHPPFLYV